MTFFPALIRALSSGAIRRFFGNLVVQFMAARLLLGGVAGGVGFIAFQTAFNKLKDYFFTGYNSLPYELVALLDIGGFKMGFGILFGAITAKMSGKAVSRIFEKV